MYMPNENKHCSAEYRHAAVAHLLGQSCVEFSLRLVPKCAVLQIKYEYNYAVSEIQTQRSYICSGIQTRVWKKAELKYVFVHQPVT